MLEYFASLTVLGIVQYVNQAGDKTTTGVVERFNRTLREIIGRNFARVQKLHWLEDLPKLVHNYNRSLRSTLGATPEDIWFGRKPPKSRVIRLERFAFQKGVAYDCFYRKEPSINVLAPSDGVRICTLSSTARVSSILCATQTTMSSRPSIVRPVFEPSPKSSDQPPHPKPSPRSPSGNNYVKQVVNDVDNACCGTWLHLHQAHVAMAYVLALGSANYDRDAISFCICL